jgi:CRP/FNR family transcriptional regulator
VDGINADDKVIPFNQNRVACEACSLAQLCLPTDLDAASLTLIDRSIKRRRPLKRGEHLFHVGGPFHSIYAIRSGSVKTYIPTEDGLEQVTGFHLSGELLGLDAINGEQHPCSAKVLETTSLCEIPFAQLGQLSGRTSTLHQHLIKILSRELLHDRSLLTLLGKKSAEERLAGLLVSLSARSRQRGFSACDFHLSMSRNDIANYLGLAVETVSRLFTRFQEDRLLEVERKHIRVVDLDGLHAVAHGGRGEKPGVRAR